MTQEEIRKLLGGYATNALNADERRILFEAALDDQELFNALQNEDALKELLDDPILRDQVRRALAAPAKPSRAAFSWRRWAFGVAIPAVVAVIVIVVMNRANAPKLISMRAPAVFPAAPPKAAPSELAPKLETAPPPVAKKRPITVRVPEAQAIPARVQLESAPVAPTFRAAAAPAIPSAVRQQFSAGFPANVPLYQGPLVRYSVVRSGPDGKDVRVEISTQMAGYAALYVVDAAGTPTRVYPINDPAALVSPGVTIQIPSAPIKIAQAGERLRLVIVPAIPSVAAGQLSSPLVGVVGGVLSGPAQRALAKPLQAPASPLVVDIPLAGN
jgi:hypothetical protein